MARNILNETLPHRKLEVTISSQLASDAVGAFFKYFEMKKETREKKSLFDYNESISVEFTLSKLFKFNKLKLHRIALPNPMEENPDPICLIVKSGFRNELKESLLNTNGIELIVTLDELPKEYKQFEDRRKLHNSYNKFICDENIQAFLPKILGVGGSHWRKPIYPISMSQNITEEALLQKIETVRASTYWHFSEGTNISVKFGHSGMTKDQLIENLVNVIPEVVSRVPEGWNSIARVGIKSVGSIYFPLYFAAPQAPNKVDLSEKRKRPRVIKEGGANENGKQNKKRFFENGETPAEETDSKKAKKQEPPAKQQKVVEEEEEEEEQEEPEDQKEEESEEEDRTPAKKRKQTAPAKQAPPPKQATPAKRATPAKQATPVQQATPAKQATPVKATPVQQATPKQATPVQQAAPVKATPVQQATPAKQATPKQATPVQQAAPVEQVTPDPKQDAPKPKYKSLSARRISKAAKDARKTQTP